MERHINVITNIYYKYFQHVFTHMGIPRRNCIILRKYKENIINCNVNDKFKKLSPIPR